ncbi:hypothetical protein [Shewanella algae]|uniref:hypothetical protein n=1 Tax=Shewanella algae TaxID=38313 RepID=UPI001AAFDB9E|nr:hypothetical protein [Shewanella algae]MBO2585553.1 hypothetical protein [Shewanella algae]
MRSLLTICMVLSLGACSIAEVELYDKYSIRIYGDEMFTSISSIGEANTSLDMIGEKFSSPELIEKESKRIKLYVSNDLLKQCRIYDVSARVIADFIDDLVSGESGDDDKSYMATMYLTLKDEFFYEYQSDVGEKELAFVFSVKDCASYHDDVFFAYSIIQHERKHIDIFMSNELKNIPKYENEYLATKLSYCSIFKNEQIKSVEIFPSEKVIYHSLRDVPKGEVIKPALGANIFHNEAFELFGILKWEKNSSKYLEIVQWCNLNVF